MPQVRGAADVLVAREVALDGEGVAVYEGQVAIRSALGGERAFEFGVAALGAVFGADEHGAALLVGGNADGPAVAECAVACPRRIGRELPVRVLGREVEALPVLAGIFLFGGVGDVQGSVEVRCAGVGR